MDLLEFGMKNRENGSRLLRTAARGILEIEKKRADLYEAYLDKKNISCPDDPSADAALFDKILEAVAHQKPQ